MDKISLVAQLGPVANLDGFKCVVTALEIVNMQNMDVISFTKEVYPTIGERLGLSAHSVERSIRYLIRKCWKRGRRDLLRELCSVTDEPPTNAEFIKALVIHLHLHEKSTTLV